MCGLEIIKSSTKYPDYTLYGYEIGIKTPGFVGQAFSNSDNECPVTTYKLFTRQGGIYKPFSSMNIYLSKEYDLMINTNTAIDIEIYIRAKTDSD